MSQFPKQQQRVTVYPSVAGGFPAASFWRYGDSFAYMREMQEAGATCGLCECPADSYHVHYPGTVRTKK